MSKIIVALLILITSVFTYAENIHLTADNHIALRNEVTMESVTNLEHQLAALVEKRGSKSYPIYLVLDSPGGSIDDGLNFIEFAKTVPNLQTVTIFAASMASAIVEALPGKRNVLSTGVLMFHRARGGVEGQFEDGELESRLSFYKSMVRTMETLNSNRMCLTLSAYKAKVKDEYWILGQESVNQKAADNVVTITCSQDLIKSNSIEAFNIMGLFTVKVSFSKCPLIRGGKVLDEKMKATYTKYRTERWSMNTK